MARRGCHCGAKQQTNGNCPVCRDDDGNVVQCVGEWSPEKHDYLHRYIEGTWAPRSRFSGGSGGAAFIDLFAGPGRAKIVKSGQVIDGSPLIALKHDKAPFSRVILCEKDQENFAALRDRTLKYGERVMPLHTDSILNIDEIVSAVPPRGLNLALVDPFGPAGLRFDVLAKLASVERMDLIIHFPIVGIRRNQESLNFDEIVGGNQWKQMPGELHHKLTSCLKLNLSKLGYQNAGIKDQPLRNSKTVLYHLIYAAKHPLGNKIWSSIIKTEAGGQKSLF